LRISHLWRAFGIAKREKNCGQGPYQIYVKYGAGFNAASLAAQQILGAPSVFNFFLPSFAPQGPVSNTGLIAPEFQIFTENVVISTASELNFQIRLSKNATGDPTQLYSSVLILDEELTWAINPEQMLDKLNLILLNGEMSTELRGIIMDHLNSGALPNSGDEVLRAKLEDAILLIVNSPDYLIQK
jgi:hypothetical protein